MAEIEQPSLNEREKIAAQVLLEEYKQGGSGINQQLTLQSEAIKLGVTTIGAFVAAIVSLKAAHLWLANYGWVLLAIPFILSTLGMWVVNKDEMILDLAGYANDVLRPALSTLCGREVLGQDQYLVRQRFGPACSLRQRIAKKLVAPFPHAFFAVLSVIALITLVYMQHAKDYVPLTQAQWLIFACDDFYVLYFSISLFVTSSRYRRFAVMPRKASLHRRFRYALGLTIRRRTRLRSLRVTVGADAETSPMEPVLQSQVIQTTDSLQLDP